MAKPLARVLMLLDILQAGGTRTLRELAERLGVDERTVRRYVDHLLDLGVPVESVRGRYGGYRLAPGYRMPPLMLTDDEALAVILGLNGARRAALDPDAAAAVESAAAKVRRVLPQAIAARLGTLVAATSYTDGRGPVAPETGILLAVAGAAVEVGRGREGTEGGGGVCGWGGRPVVGSGWSGVGRVGGLGLGGESGGVEEGRAGCEPGAVGRGGGAGRWGAWYLGGFRGGERGEEGGGGAGS